MRSTLKTLTARFAKSESGATLVEYGIAVVLAVIVGTGGLIAMANQVDSNMGGAQTAMVPAGNTNFTDCSGTNAAGAANC